jgi:hypothetical protein
MRKRINTEEPPQAAEQPPAEIDWDRCKPEEWLREMFPSFLRDFPPIRSSRVPRAIDTSRMSTSRRTRGVAGDRGVSGLREQAMAALLSNRSDARAA